MMKAFNHLKVYISLEEVNREIEKIKLNMKSNAEIKCRQCKI